MTMWRDVDQLNVITYPETAAELAAGMGYDDDLYGATIDRATWEAGYTAGLANCEAELALHDVSRILLNGMYGKAVQQRDYWQRQAEQMAARLHNDEQTILAQQTSFDGLARECHRLEAERDEARSMCLVSDAIARQVTAEVERLEGELARARAWSAAWKEAAKTERFWCINWQCLADQQGEHINELWEVIDPCGQEAAAAVYQQQAGAGDAAGSDDPYHVFGQWAEANGHDLDTQDGRDRAIAAYGETAGSESE